MDWSLILFIAVVLFFAWRGFRNGLYKSLARVVSLLAGYGCAILFTGKLTPLIESEFGLAGIAGFITASLILFAGASFAVSLIFWLVGKLLLDPGPPSTASAAGGGAIGSLVGVLLALIVVWTWGFVRGMQPVADSVAHTPPGKIEALANRAASGVVASAMDLGSAQPEVSNLSAALVASPGEIAQRGKRLLENKDLIDLINKPENQRLLDSGDISRVQSLPEFQRLVRDPDLQALASAAGMDQESGAAMEAKLAQQLTETWNRVQRVKNNRRVQEIINNPEFLQRVRSGNPLELINNAELLELADIIFADESPLAEPRDTAASAESGGEARVYRWTDSSGRVQYSDQKPEE